MSFNRGTNWFGKAESLAGVRSLLQEPLSVRLVLSAGPRASSLLVNTGLKVAATKKKKCLCQTGGEQQVKEAA